MELQIEDNERPNVVPPYFRVSAQYDKIRVGHLSKAYNVVNMTGYDYYILAGIESNELFSKLVMVNMNIADGCAIEYNTNKIAVGFPENMKVLKKNVSHIQSNTTENMKYFIDKYSDIMMKMNIHGSEYLWFLSIPSECLTKFKQLIVTFHDINNNPTRERAINKINCFKKIALTHEIAHTEYDNGSLIMTYVRKGEKDDKQKAQEEEAKKKAEEEEEEEG